MSTEHTVQDHISVTTDSHCQSSNTEVASTIQMLPTTPLTVIAAIPTSCAQYICNVSLDTVALQDAANRLSKDDCELLIAHMVQRGMLQLDFGFTAYATNTYLKAAPRALQMLAGSVSLHQYPLMTIPHCITYRQTQLFDAWHFAAMCDFPFVTHF